MIPLLALLSALAWAESPESDSTAPVADPPTDAEISEKEAAAFYTLGLELVVAEKWDEACAVQLRVSETWAGTEWATRAFEQMRLIGEAHPETECGGGKGVGRNSGRVELVISQGIVVPTFTGVVAPFAFSPAIVSPVLPVLTGIGGLAAGIGGTWALTERFPVTTGQAMAIYTGEIMGGWNGAALAFLANPRVFIRPTTPFQYIGAGTLLGAGAGVAAAVYLDPSPGQMAAVRSGATWGTAFSGISFLLVEPGNPSEAFGRLAGGTDLGLGIGVGLAALGTGSRTRVNLVNLAGYAGGAVGGGALLIGSFYGGLGPRGAGAILAGTTAVGLGMGIFLTRAMPADDTAVVADGVILGHDPETGWRFGMPAPMIRPTQDGSLAVDVALARGRF